MSPICTLICANQSPSRAQGTRMHVGKLAFTQLRDCFSWKSFGCIVERYGGDRRVRDFSFLVTRKRHFPDIVNVRVTVESRPAHGTDCHVR